MVVNGDLTQIDLPKGESGLRRAVDVLEDVEDVAVRYFTDRDVVRNDLVRRIVLAYAAAEEREKKDGGEKSEKTNAKDRKE